MSTVCRICKAESSYHYSFSVVFFEMEAFKRQTPTLVLVTVQTCISIDASPMLFQSFGRPPGNAGFAYHIILVTICNIQHFINTMFMLFINLIGSKLKHLREGELQQKTEACTPYVVNSNTTKVCACLPPEWSVPAIYSSYYD